MAVIRQNGLQVKVNTITDRDAITKRPEFLVVHVKDAIADIDAGAGSAVYRWTNDNGGKWILISKGAEKSLSFATEELLIANGQVVASNVPENGLIWHIEVLNGNVAIAYPRVEDLNISGATIAGLDGYNSYKLRFTYAYGSLSAQMQTILNTKSNFYEQNTDPLSVSGNTVKPGDFWHDTSNEGTIAICLTMGGTLTWMVV